MTTALLPDIREFLTRTGMGPKYFGVRACGNSKLVERLESGGDVTTATAEKVRAFIAERSVEAAE